MAGPKQIIGRPERATGLTISEIQASNKVMQMGAGEDHGQIQIVGWEQSQHDQSKEESDTVSLRQLISKDQAAAANGDSLTIDNLWKILSQEKQAQAMRSATPPKAEDRPSSRSRSGMGRTDSANRRAAYAAGEDFKQNEAGRRPTRPSDLFSTPYTKTDLSRHPCTEGKALASVPAGAYRRDAFGA